ERLACGASLDDRAAVGSQPLGQRPANQLLVVNDQHGRHESGLYENAQVVGLAISEDVLKGLCDDRVANDLDDVVQIKGLGDGTKCACPHSFLKDLSGAVSGHQDDARSAITLSKRAKKAQVFGIRQLQIKQHHRDVIPFLHAL